MIIVSSVILQTLVQFLEQSRSCLCVIVSGCFNLEEATCFTGFSTVYELQTAWQPMLASHILNPLSVNTQDSLVPQNGLPLGVLTMGV